jgi:RecA-family ATPase
VTHFDSDFKELVPVTPLRPRSKVTFERTSTSTIMGTNFPPIRWAVPGYVVEGLSLLAGRQKIGKTYLAMDFAIAVATGGVAMGQIECEKGDVLYIDLENGPRRIRSRIEDRYPDPRNRPDLDRLQWMSDAPQLDKGFIACLDDWHGSVLKPRLVVIDVLQRIKPAGIGNRNAYENDYAILSELQQWATRNGIAVVALMHTRKGGADDPLEAVNGSNGMSACADSTLILDRKSGGLSLYVRGRDIEEKESALLFSDGNWTLQGEVAEVHRSAERREILEELLAAVEPPTPGEIAAAIGKKRNSVDQMLRRMVKSGEVIKVGRGRYAHPARQNARTPDPQ